MPTNLIGEQTPRPYGIIGPWVFSGSLAANTPTTVLLSNANQFEHKVPVLNACLVAAISSYRNANTTAGDVTVQLATIPAAAAAGTLLQAVAGASFVVPAAGGQAYVNFLPGGQSLGAGDQVGVILTAANAGTCLLTVNMVLST